MQKYEQTYQSILKHLAAVPVDYLEKIDAFIQKISADIAVQKKSKKNPNLDFAGAWADMTQEDFEDFLKIAKQTNQTLFNRKFDL